MAWRATSRFRVGRTVGSVSAITWVEVRQIFGTRGATVAATEMTAESISADVHEPTEMLTAVRPPGGQRRPPQGGRAHVRATWRERNLVACFLGFLRALDDDPILMCGYPVGRPCGDPVPGADS